MKNIFIRILNWGIGLLGCGMCVISCDYLDQKPENLRTPDLIWKTRADAESYLYNIYGYIWLSDDDAVLFGFADETSCPLTGVKVRQMIEGNWGPSNTDSWDRWTSAYRAIRKALIFESNVDRVPEDKLSEELKVQYKAESRFLRGWFYWKILQLYGPFVIFSKATEMDEDFSSYSRSSFDECVEYICKLMNSAKDDLPLEWGSNAYYGRPTKGACLAVISQVRLLAASELWNGNPRFSNFKNKDGKPLAPLIKDMKKWEAAAQAAWNVIDLGIYRLFRNTDEGDARFDPYVSCRDLFLTTGSNTETIFATYNSADDWYWGHDKRCTPKPYGHGMQNATQNIVDAFYTRNGKDIHDDPEYTEVGFAQAEDNAGYGSVHDNVNRGYRKGESNMYVNREPRFYAFVHYNGRPVICATTVDDRNAFSSANNKDGQGRVEYYYSGVSGSKANNDLSDHTGYNVAKRVSYAANMAVDGHIYRPYLHIRYAEILLNYIEALNEYDPTNPDIVNYLNEIRSRAGVPSIQSAYPADLGDTERMRKWILRERQIELAFEGDRFWTMGRRLLFENEENRKIYRMNVNTDDGGQGFSYEDFYKRQLLQTRYWDNKMYLFPISQYDIDRGRGLVQNPGW